MRVLRGWQDKVRRASAAARSAMKVVAAASPTLGGRRAGRCCLRAWDGWGRVSKRTSSGGRARAAVVALGLDLGSGLAAGCGRGALTGLGGCLAAVLGFGWVAGVGLVGAWAFSAVGLLAVGAGLGARLEGVPRGLGGGELNEHVVVVMDEVVVVVEVVGSEANERAVGDGRGSWVSGAGVGCWVLQVARTRVRVRAPGVCVCFPWLSVRAGAGVAVLSRLRGHVGYPGGGHICSRTCRCVCWR